MRRKNYVLLAMVLISLTACADASSKGEENIQESVVNVQESVVEDLSEEYKELNDQLQAKIEECASLKNDYDKLSNDFGSTLADYNKLKADYSTMESEYTQYKEKMQEYEDLQEKEKEARRIQAERAIAEEEARKQKELEEEARREEEERKREEAEEKRGYNTGITYKQLARTPDEYEGEKIKFTGRVVQVVDGTKQVQIRLAVNGNYDTILYCVYDPNILDFRILEDDQITIYGISKGLYSYQSTGAGVITIPCATIDKIELPFYICVSSKKSCAKCTKGSRPTVS